MAHARDVRDQPSHGVLRARRATGRRGDDHAGSLSIRKVVVYTAEGCGLCERALEVVREARTELGFELEIVDIGGDPELEARYREHLPVIEIDGEQAFTYFVEHAALRDRLST